MEGDSGAGRRGEAHCSVGAGRKGDGGKLRCEAGSGDRDVYSERDAFGNGERGEGLGGGGGSGRESRSGIRILVLLVDKRPVGAHCAPCPPRSV